MTTRSNLVPGLVSITFRKLSTDEVIELACRAGLRSIEWGADVHVKPDALDVAKAVGAATRAAGLDVSSYGSYYRAGQALETFSAILQAAVALGAPRIRVWAGVKGPGEHTPEERQRVTEDIRRIAKLAARENIRIALEFHSGTLTADAGSAVALLRALDEVRVESYWQPRVDADFDSVMADLAVLAPWLCHAHVFHWGPGIDRHPLARGADRWTHYLKFLSELKRPIQAQLEYVLDNRPEQLLDDAAALRGWISDLA